MKENTASKSAAIIAAHRALDAAKNHNERICYDPFARKFLPAGFTVIGPGDIPEQKALAIFKDLVPGFHEFFLARTRYIDDYIQHVAGNHLEQLVILGAGYDSRAYRLDGLKNRVRVFEVDHPATQKVKIEKLLETFDELPENVTFIPADFQTRDLYTHLTGFGYEDDLKTVFVLEGVSMYIGPDAMDEILRCISSHSGPGSSLIFDYTCPEVITGTCDRKEAREWLKITQNSEEPLLFSIKTEGITTYLSTRGFSNINNVTSSYFNRTYFTGVNEGRESTPILSLVHAEVLE